MERVRSWFFPRGILFIFPSSHSSRELELIPALLLNQLNEVLVDLSEVLAILLLLLDLLGLLAAADARLLRDHDNARGPLRRSRGAELGPRRHEDVRHVDVLAQHRDVADDVRGADVASQDDDPWE